MQKITCTNGYIVTVTPERHPLAVKVSVHYHDPQTGKDGPARNATFDRDAALNLAAAILSTLEEQQS